MVSYLFCLQPLWWVIVGVNRFLQNQLVMKFKLIQSLLMEIQMESPSHNEFQFVFGNGIVATLDSDVAGLFAQRLGCLYGKRGTNKVGERYPKPKSKDAVLVATFDEGFIGANGKIYKSEKEYNYDPNTNIWISLDDFGKYPPQLGGMNKLVLK
jgi:hypothetical protein